MFFNKNQKIYNAQINNSVTRFGNPKIVEDKKKLRVIIEKIKDCQNLFVFDSGGNDSSLLGVLIYYRESLKNIVILHIAVTEECSVTGKYHGEYITFRLINRLKEDVGKIKGVETVSFAYKTGNTGLSQIPVKHKSFL